MLSRQGTCIWFIQLASNRVEAGLEAVQGFGTDSLVREVVPHRGYSVAEEVPPGWALGGLNLESIFVTSNRTSGVEAKDGVHVLSRGQPAYVEQSVLHFIKRYNVTTGSTCISMCFILESYQLIDKLIIFYSTPTFPQLKHFRIQYFIIEFVGYAFCSVLYGYMAFIEFVCFVFLVLSFYIPPPHYFEYFTIKVIIRKFDVNLKDQSFFLSSIRFV